MIQVQDLTVSYGTVDVLQSVSFGLQGGETLAIVGANGSGKTTLLRCVAGENTAFEGAVVLNKGVRIAYLVQEDETPFDGTALERALSTDRNLLEIYQEMRSGKYERVQEYSDLGGYVLEDRVRIFAENFGIAEVLDEAYEILSRGQRRKVDLVRTLVSNVEVLLFDEPVNFLDIRGITAFEEAVADAKSQGKAVLVVSHDRELLDDVADRTVYIERGRVFQVQGGYTEAIEQKERAYQGEVDRARVLRGKIGALQEAMRRRMGWGVQREKETKDSSSRRLAAKVMKTAKAMERRLEKKKEELEQEKPWVEKEIRLRFPAYSVDRRLWSRLDRVGKQFGDHVVFEGVDLAVETKSRISIVGENGAGKTTLLNLLTGEMIADSGESYLNSGVKVGYLTQGLDGFYSRDILLHHFLDTGYAESEVRQFLGAAKLREEQVLRLVGTLSYGERMRGAIVKMILEQMEFLVLDEPTTHLDIESVEVLEQLLGEFSGGFLVVSHDRRLISAVSDVIYTLSDGRLERL